MSKRILSLVLALVMVLGTFGTVFAEEAATEKAAEKAAEKATEKITDTNSEKIDWLVKQGIVKGTGKGLELDKTVDRATLARIVAVALNLEAEAEALKHVPSGFVDMTTEHWANGYAALANGKGYMVGNNKQQFLPSQPATYAEVLSLLVRVNLGGDLKPEEKAGAITWYAPYIAKAAELEITKGVSISNVGAEAVRKDILEMLYNVLQSTKNARYDVLKGIVLENSRVAKLDKDEIKIEVIEEVKRTNYSEDSKKIKGEEKTLNIAGLDVDAEDLLGRVADFTFDKDGKLVDVKVDESYKVETGSFKATRNSIGSYYVEVDERYSREKESDRTIFRTYYNNKAYAYEDFYTTPDAKRDDRTDEFKPDYARVTVKNGRAIFIDAFDFEDIAPVKEVKKDGAEVLVYNDLRNGSVKTIKVENSDKVMTFSDGTMKAGDKSDIKANDVIHVFDDGDGFIVRKDASVNGTFKKVSEDRDDRVYVHVDEEKYEVLDKDYKRPVYAYDDAKEFFTLRRDEVANTLRQFKDEKVTLLLDISGKLQYIGSELELGEFVALVTRVSGNKVRVIKSDGKTYDYETNLDTREDGKEIENGSLVYMSVDGEIIDTIEGLTDKETKGVEVKGFNTREIKLEGYKDGFRILDETSIFSSKNLTAATLKAAIDSYEAHKDKGEKVEAIVIDGEYIEKIASRRSIANVARKGEAYAIVFTNIDVKPDTKGLVAEFAGYEDWHEKEMKLRFDGDVEETRKLDKNAEIVEIVDGKEKNVTLRGGDIVEIQETKDSDKLITKVVRLIEKRDKDNYYKVVDFDGRDLKLADKYGETETFRVDSKTAIFGGDIRESRDRRDREVEAISYVLEEVDGKTTGYVKAVLVRGEVKESDITGVLKGSKAPVKGKVTYVNKDRLFVDDERYTLDKDTILKNAEGTVVAVGGEDIEQWLSKGDEIERVEAKGGVATIIVAKSIAKESVADQNQAKKVNDLIEALPAKVDETHEQTIKEAREAYEDLTPAQKKLVKADNVTKLEEAEKALDEAFAKKVNDLIEALPAKVDETHEQTIKEARKAYEDLTDAQKKLVKADNVTKLEEAEEALEKELSDKELNDAVDAVNKAGTRIEMKRALGAEVLGLNIPADKLDDVADYVLTKRPDNTGYADEDAISAIVEEALAL